MLHTSKNLLYATIRGMSFVVPQVFRGQFC